MMKNGVAIWHYPHRSLIENVRYFAACGYDSVSIHGNSLYSALSTDESARELAQAVKSTGVLLTVHSALPQDHTKAATDAYRAKIDAYAKWQREYRLIHILSFDVLQGIRDHITEYVEYAMSALPETYVALEDFGLNDNELKQLAPFVGNRHFGFLVDVGHMCIRLHGKNTSGLTLFSNSKAEGEPKGAPSYEDYLYAFRSKSFPIFEIHLHQNDGVSDIHQFLDTGVIDMGAIRRVLDTVAFEGIVTLECAPGFKFECKYPQSDIRIQESFTLWKATSGL